jgi:hypothetical protein
MCDTPAIDWWRTVANLPSAAERLEKMVEHSCRVLARTRPLHTIVRGSVELAALGADLGRELQQDRLRIQTDRIRHFLRHELRPGLSVAEAGQRYCALTGPELYHSMTVELGWTADAFRGWLTRVLLGELLGTRPAGANAPPQLSEPVPA